MLRNKMYALLGNHLSIAIQLVVLFAIQRNDRHNFGMSLALKLPIKLANNETETPANVSESSLFDIPMRMDEEDILQEYGRFMLANMNETINPCEDFYEYACGNWKTDEMIPSRLRNGTFLGAIQHHIEQMVMKYLNTTTEQELLNNTAEAKAKQFYHSCLKMNKDMSLGYKTLMESVEFTRAVQPQNANETFDWMNVNFISLYGMYPLLPLKVNYNTEYRKFDIILGLPNKALSNPDIVDIKNLTRDFGIEGEDVIKNFTAEFMQMSIFEKNLTELISKRNETEELTMEKFILAHKADKMNWTRFFEIAFNGTKVEKDWLVHSAWQDVNSLVHYLNKTDLGTLRTYVKWRTLLKFYYIWKSETNDKLISSVCRKHTEQYFNYALIPWFIDAVYDMERRANLLEMATLIRDKFYDIIDKYQWLDDETKSQAKTKLKSMDIEVGYSDEMRHRDVIDQVYKDLNITGHWYKNIQALEANRIRVRMKSVNKALIPILMSTRDVNAYYADFLNLVYITIGIAQFPMYHLKFPESLKYGGIGNIIGHEMAHGFDTYCYQYNYDGKKLNWWSEQSLRNFRERYRCMESQYNKYIYEGVATNGSMTSGDNIADNVGMRLAYYTYMQKFGQKDGNQKPIAGLKFNNKQLFFLKFAQTWCTGKNQTQNIKKIKSDVHAYEEFRVLGTLSNMPEFSEVFKCKLGTAMNPLKKCVVW